MMGFKIAGIIGLVLLVATGGFYLYYKDTQQRMQALAESNAKLSMGIQINEKTIDSLNSSIDSAHAELSRVYKAFSDAQMRNRQLVDRLSEHEIGKLASKKAKLVENVVNNASQKASRCFEIISGSPLTDQEKGAKDAKSFNSECPWLWPGTP